VCVRVVECGVVGSSGFLFPFTPIPVYQFPFSRFTMFIPIPVGFPWENGNSHSSHRSLVEEVLRAECRMLLMQECEVIDDVRILKPMFKQRLAVNSKTLVITDIGLLSVYHHFTDAVCL